MAMRFSCLARISGDSTITST